MKRLFAVLASLACAMGLVLGVAGHDPAEDGGGGAGGISGQQQTFTPAINYTFTVGQHVNQEITMTSAACTPHGRHTGGIAGFYRYIKGYRPNHIEHQGVFNGLVPVDEAVYNISHGWYGVQGTDADRDAARAYLRGTPLRPTSTPIIYPVIGYCRDLNTNRQYSTTQWVHVTITGTARTDIAHAHYYDHHHAEYALASALVPLLSQTMADGRYAALAHTHPTAPAPDLSGYSLTSHTHPAPTGFVAQSVHDAAIARIGVLELGLGKMMCEDGPGWLWDASREWGASSLQRDAAYTAIPAAVRAHCCKPEEPGDTVAQCFSPSAQGQGGTPPLLDGTGLPDAPTVPDLRK